MRGFVSVVVMLAAISLSAAQGRKVVLSGALRTAPVGTRFALGTRGGTLSVETKGATIRLSGRPAKLTSLRPGSSVTVVGDLVPASATGRATIFAKVIEIARAGTPPTRPALKRG